MRTSSPTTHRGASSQFHTTHWSVVRTAGDASAPAARQALEQLCETYWPPLHAYIRRRGNDAEASRDLTQGFFASFLARDDLAEVDPQRGRFRAYLLASVKHFLANERARDGALKRGGGQQPLSLDLGRVGELPFLEPVDERSPDAVFERQWAIAMMQRAMDRLRNERVAAGRGELFERLRETLAGEQIPGGRSALADELGLSPVALRVAVYRLRKRYRELLLEEVAHTVDRPEDVRDEIRQLFKALER